MDTIKRVHDLAEERGISVYQLAQQCDISYSTIKSAEKRGTQLRFDTVERICSALGITMQTFCTEPESDTTGT